jgi:hypothetical protein
MATTTNYGWTTPDDTALVKDGAAAIRTLGSSVDTTTKALNPETTLGDLAYRSSTTNVNTRLALGTANQVLKVNSGATAPEWAVDPTTDVVTTAGDLIYGTAADTVTRLGIGTANQVLRVNSSATAPEWVTVPGGGKVLQVVQGTTTTPVSNATTTEADTGITATITPSSATSKILVLTSINGCYKSNGNVSNGLRLRLYRGATDIARIATYLQYTGTAIELYGNSGLSYLDSPATTSATTYKVTFQNVTNASNVVVQDSNERSTIVLLEIGA